MIYSISYKPMMLLLTEIKKHLLNWNKAEQI